MKQISIILQLEKKNSATSYVTFAAKENYRFYWGKNTEKKKEKQREKRQESKREEVPCFWFLPSKNKTIVLKIHNY